MSENIWQTNSENIVSTLQKGGVVVMPTDTIYGMVAKAGDESVVNRVYEIRHRAPEKPFIILIGSIAELAKFGVVPTAAQEMKLEGYWPASAGAEAGLPDASRPTSIIIDCPDEKFAYLHRGTKSLAFRLPTPAALRDLLVETGPLIAPSANIEKFPESESIEDAKNYFGDKVDLYIDAGHVTSRASRIIKLDELGQETVLRD